jgi:5-methylcytosine-specific restriction endonuclease McrA
MISKLLRRLVSTSASTSGDAGTQARKRPATERQSQQVPIGEPLPSSWARMHVWWRDQGRCVLCGEREGVWFDYIIPVREGGSNTEDNIRLMCERCQRGEKGVSIRRRKRLGA